MGGEISLLGFISLYHITVDLSPAYRQPYQKFMFDTPLAIENNGETKTDPVYKMLQPIKKSKYPDITEVRHTCFTILLLHIMYNMHLSFKNANILYRLRQRKKSRCLYKLCVVPSLMQSLCT